MKSKFCNSLFKYIKRDSIAVKVGRDVVIGGYNNIVIQSMGTVSTNEIDKATDQAILIAKSGAQLVRFTAQGVIEAENMALIREKMNSLGCYVPLVADIHFNPKAAFVAAKHIEKVRINPGNFTDIKSIGIYSDELYESELGRLRVAFTELLDLSKNHGTVLRIGVNHGSLSDRIVGRYGDTVEGMVESAMELLRVAKREKFDNIVVSLKSSNTKVMVSAYRLLTSVMKENDMNYPLHLGVTEAGDGDQGRIRSAVGIGAILIDGIGDTIRVSLTENPENEVVFAKMILSYIEEISNIVTEDLLPELAIRLERRYQLLDRTHSTIPFMIIDGSSVLNSDSELDVFTTDNIINGNKKSVRLSFNAINSDIVNTHDLEQNDFIIVEEPSIHSIRAVLLWIEDMRSNDRLMKQKIVIKRDYSLNRSEFMAAVGIDLGGLLIDGFADGLWITNSVIGLDDSVKIVLDVMQASRRRIYSTEYISCPGCGRTLYDIQSVLERVKESTKGLKNIKIAVMGCIVNGPGEMADADYGYVGASRGKVTLYKKGKVYKKNIDQDMALEELINLLRENNEFI